LLDENTWIGGSFIDVDLLGFLILDEWLVIDDLDLVGFHTNCISFNLERLFNMIVLLELVDHLLRSHHSKQLVGIALIFGFFLLDLLLNYLSFFLNYIIKSKHWCLNLWKSFDLDVEECFLSKLDIISMV
jgi:hypothetical protein